MRTQTPIHPGEILGDELSALDMSAGQLARKLDVPENRISQIVSGKRALSADTALRLGHYFGTSADIWLNLQKAYDLDCARDELGDTLTALPQRPQHGDTDTERV